MRRKILFIIKFLLAVKKIKNKWLNKIPACAGVTFYNSKKEKNCSFGVGRNLLLL